MACIFCRVNFLEWRDIKLQLSVVNDQNEPIEVVQEIDSPAYTSSDCIYWGYTWYMQTPLENIGEGFGLVVRILRDNASSTPVARYHFNKETIDSGAYTFELLSAVVAISTLTSADRAAKSESDVISSFMHSISPRPEAHGPVVIPTGTTDSTLTSVIEITKMFRRVDISTTVRAPVAKVFEYKATGKTPYELLYPKPESPPVTSPVLAPTVATPYEPVTVTELNVVHVAIDPVPADGPTTVAVSESVSDVIVAVVPDHSVVEEKVESTTTVDPATEKTPVSVKETASVPEIAPSVPDAATVTESSTEPIHASNPTEPSPAIETAPIVIPATTTAPAATDIFIDTSADTEVDDEDGRRTPTDAHLSWAEVPSALELEIIAAHTSKEAQRGA